MPAWACPSNFLWATAPTAPTLALGMRHATAVIFFIFSKYEYGPSRGAAAVHCGRVTSRVEATRAPSMKPQQAQPPPGSPQEPPPPWWHLHRWEPVHLAVLGVSLFVLLGVVIARVDVYEWRRHHVPQSDYETFQYPCQARRATRSCCAKAMPCRAPDALHSLNAGGKPTPLAVLLA